MADGGGTVGRLWCLWGADGAALEQVALIAAAVALLAAPAGAPPLAGRVSDQAHRTHQSSLQIGV